MPYCRKCGIELTGPPEAFRHCPACGAAQPTSDAIGDADPPVAARAEPPGSPQPVESAAKATSWFYLVDGQQTGPVTEDALRGLIAAGRIRHHDLVWAEGTPSWVSAGSVPALVPQRRATPAPLQPADAGPQVAVATSAPGADVSPAAAAPQDQRQAAAEDASGPAHDTVPRVGLASEKDRFLVCPHCAGLNPRDVIRCQWCQTRFLTGRVIDGMSDADLASTITRDRANYTDDVIAKAEASFSARGLKLEDAQSLIEADAVEAKRFASFASKKEGSGLEVPAGQGGLQVEVEIAPDTMRTYYLLGLHEAIMSGEVKPTMPARKLVARKPGAKSQPKWSTVQKLTNSIGGLRPLYRPIWNTALKYAGYGALAGIALKAIDTTVTLFAASQSTGMLWLLFLGLMVAANLRKELNWLWVAALVISVLTGVNLFVAGLATAAVGASFGAPAGLAVGTIVGALHARSATRAPLAVPEGAGVFLYGLAAPVAFLAAWIPGYMWLNSMLIKWLSGQ